MSDLTLIDAEIPEADGCQVLTKTRAFMVDQSWAGSLRWYLLDRSGQKADLTSLYGGGSEDAAVSEDAADLEDDPSVVVAFHELSVMECQDPILVNATIHDFEVGEVRAAIPTAVSQKPGIYHVHWALKDSSGNNVLINRTLLSVEPTLFTNTTDQRPAMTFERIRHYLQDFRQENFLLGDVEFDDADIAQAILRPIQDWNEYSPLIVGFDTTTFPWVQAWTSAIVAHLLMSAAIKYERNNLRMSAGGVNVPDQDKSAKYAQLAKIHLDEWRVFLKRKKIELNISKGFGGNIPSVYNNL